MMRSLVLLALLTACTGIGETRVEGWPALTVVEHRVPHAEMRTRCGVYAPALVSPEACATFNFAEARCDIILSSDFPDERAREHELAHCAGYDHPGESNMEAMLRSSKQ